MIGDPFVSGLAKSWTIKRDAQNLIETPKFHGGERSCWNSGHAASYKSCSLQAYLRFAGKSQADGGPVQEELRTSERTTKI